MKYLKDNATLNIASGKIGPGKINVDKIINNIQMVSYESGWPESLINGMLSFKFITMTVKPQSH